VDIVRVENSASSSIAKKLSFLRSCQAE
jgi:hypothetical protein